MDCNKMQAHRWNKLQSSSTLGITRIHREIWIHILRFIFSHRWRPIINKSRSTASAWWLQDFLYLFVCKEIHGFWYWKGVSMQWPCSDECPALLCVTVTMQSCRDSKEIAQTSLTRVALFWKVLKAPQFASSVQLALAEVPLALRWKVHILNGFISWLMCLTSTLSEENYIVTVTMQSCMHS